MYRPCLRAALAAVPHPKPCNALMFVLHTTVSTMPALRHCWIVLMDRLRKADIGSLFQFPVLNAEVLERATAMLGSDWRTAHVEALAELSGQQVRVCSGWGSQRVAVLARTILPEDLAPVLVLDASARVRETYKLWSETRGGVVFLPAATKDYSPLAIHFARVGAGKSSWGLNGQALAKTVAEVPVLNH